MIHTIEEIWLCISRDASQNCCKQCPLNYGIMTKHHACLTKYADITHGIWIYYDLRDDSDPEGHDGYKKCPITGHSTVLMKKYRPDEI